MGEYSQATGKTVDFGLVGIDEYAQPSGKTLDFELIEATTVSFSETLGFNDAYNREGTFLRSQLENLVFDDSDIRQIEDVLQESVFLNDAVSKKVKKPVSEDLVLDESYSRTGEFFRNYNEDFTLNGFSEIFAVVRLDERLTVNDSDIREVEKFILEGVGLNDQYSRTGTFFRNYQDDLTLNDFFNSAKIRFITATERLGLNDTTELLTVLRLDEHFRFSNSRFYDQFEDDADGTTPNGWTGDTSVFEADTANPISGTTSAIFNSGTSITGAETATYRIEGPSLTDDADAGFSLSVRPQSTRSGDGFGSVFIDFFDENDESSGYLQFEYDNDGTKDIIFYNGSDNVLRSFTDGTVYDIDIKYRYNAPEGRQVAVYINDVLEFEGEINSFGSATSVDYVEVQASPSGSAPGDEISFENFAFDDFEAVYRGNTLNFEADFFRDYNESLGLTESFSFFMEKQLDEGFSLATFAPVTTVVRLDEVLTLDETVSKKPVKSLDETFTLDDTIRSRDVFAVRSERLGIDDADIRELQRTLEESIGASEAYSRTGDFFRTIDESFSLNDADVTLTMNKVLDEETLGVADRDVTFQIEKVLNEGFGLAEVFISDAEYFRNYSEEFRIADTKDFTKIFFREFDETLTASDAVRKQIQKTLNETLSIDDVFNQFFSEGPGTPPYYLRNSIVKANSVQNQFATKSIQNLFESLSIQNSLGDQEQT